jgi:hypothetical protein
VNLERDTVRGRLKAQALELEAWSTSSIAPSATESTTGVSDEFSPIRSSLKWVFSFPTMLGALLVGVVFCEGRQFSLDPDVWWHIKSGQTILATHHWPTTDPYSFTVTGQPWIAYEWLGDLLLATVSRIGGLRGLDLLLIVIGSAVILGLYLLGTVSSGSSKAGFVAAALVCPLAFANFNLRPQMLGYLFLIVSIVVLELYRQGRARVIWILPPLLLVWVNTHGSWIIGLGTMLVYWICGLVEFETGAIKTKRWKPNERKQLSLVFLASLAAATITPYGSELAFLPFRVASSLPVSMANIDEWHSMPFNMEFGKIFLVLLLAFFLAQIAIGMAWSLEQVVLFFVGTGLACLHDRFLLIFVPFFVPLLAQVLGTWLTPYSRTSDHPLLNATLMTVLAIMMFHFSPSRGDLEQKIAQRFPVHAVEYLRERAVPRPMFDSYDFGGYLVWADQKVFVDGRSELYEWGGVLSDYMYIAMLKPGALNVLRMYGIQSCLLDRDQPLATVLKALPDWKTVYEDNRSVILVHQDATQSIPATTSLAARAEQQ